NSARNSICFWEKSCGSSMMGSLGGATSPPVLAILTSPEAFFQFRLDHWLVQDQGTNCARTVADGPPLPRIGCTAQPGVAQRPPGKRRPSPVDLPRRGCTQAAPSVSNPFGVDPVGTGPGPRGALRDPGLCCATASR